MHNTINKINRDKQYNLQKKLILNKLKQIFII